MYIKVRVIAGAKKEVLKKISSDTYTVSVREEAKQNQANKRVVELIARECRVAVGKVRVVSGHHHPHKILSVTLDSTK